MVLLFYIVILLRTVIQHQDCFVSIFCFFFFSCSQPSRELAQQVCNVKWNCYWIVSFFLVVDCHDIMTTALMQIILCWMSRPTIRSRCSRSIYQAHKSSKLSKLTCVLMQCCCIVAKISSNERAFLSDKLNEQANNIIICYQNPL